MSADTPERDTIVIKRYASRRLYNSDISEYVTLGEVADLIRAGKDVKIVDKKTGEDLTRQYLLQIISEQEANGESAFPASILMEVIRAYKDRTQALMPDFLSRSYEIFKEQQALFLEQQKAVLKKASPQTTTPPSSAAMMQAWQERMGAWLGQGLTGNMAAGFNSADPAKVNPMAGMDFAKWQEQQQKFFQTAMASLAPKSNTKSESEPQPSPQAASTKDAEIAAMKAQLDALTKKLGEL